MDVAACGCARQQGAAECLHKGCYERQYTRCAAAAAAVQVLEGSVPLPPAYKVTAQSVANKDEPFISGIDNNKEALAAFMASINSSAAAAPAAAAAAAPASAPQQQQQRQYKLVQFLTPQEMVATQLPHLQWDAKVPRMLSFYSFAAFEVL
jgi:lipoprotein-anchoring transpeptidase ErfK/SrfK